MTSYRRVVLVATIIAAFAVGSFYGSLQFSQAAPNLGDAASLTQNNEFTGVLNKFPKGIYIGEQGTGGVTFFNGTIINQTTTSSGAGIPVTIGDDLRVDGQIWRGANAGTSDSMPVKVDDNLEVTGTVIGGNIMTESIERPTGTPVLVTTTTSGTNCTSPEADDGAGYFEVVVNFDWH
ncbi:hypothetical protein ACFL0Z_03035, partial [Patescibacteria group bacterium]